MGRSSGSKSLKASLRILRRLLDGEVLRVSDVAGEGGRRAVQNERLQLLAEHLPWVERQGGGQGVAQSFRWVWPTDQRTRPEQVWALAAARTMLHAFRDSEVGGVLSELIEDHVRRLPDNRPMEEDLSRMFYTATRMISPSNLDPDVVDRLAKATSERRTVSACYTQFDGSERTVIIEPWTLVFADEGPYLFGRCLESTKQDHIDRTRVFNVARMKRVRLTPDRFVYPLRAEHDPYALFEHCFTIMVPADEAPVPPAVELRFAPSMGAYLQNHTVHPAQEDVEEDEAGHIVWRARLHITYDLVRWVRGHGRTVEVISPANLRDWVESGTGGEGYKSFVLRGQ